MILIKSFGRLASTDAKNLITIQNSCLNRLKQVLSKPDEEFLRIHVETGGCSGFSYLFQIENKQSFDDKEDLIFERENYKVVINKNILPYMKGSSIEYNESLIKSSFNVTNPIADTKCGCGTSFSINLSKLSQQKEQVKQEK